MRAVGYASRRRDDIAHGIVAGFHAGQKSHGYLLIPSQYNADRNRAFVPIKEIRDDGSESQFPFHHLPGIYRYNSQDIKNITSLFHVLFQSVMTHQTLFTEWKEKAISSSTDRDNAQASEDKEM